MTRRTFFSVLAGIAAAVAFPCKRRAASAVTAAVTATRSSLPIYTVYRSGLSSWRGIYKISGDEVTLIRVEPIWSLPAAR